MILFWRQIVNIKIFKLNALHTRDRSLVIRFLVSYLIILLIPVFIGILVYKEAVKIVESDVKASNLSMLGQCRDIIDQQLAAVDIMKGQIGLAPQLNLSLKHDSGTRELSFYYEMRKLMDQLRPYSLSGNIVDSFFIYMKEPNYVISPIIAYDADFFFESVFKYDRFGREQWLEELSKYHSGSVLPASNAVLESRNIEVIPYLHSLPTTHYRKVQGAIVFLLRAETIHHLLSRINLIKDGWVFVVDQNNQIITSYSRHKIPNQLPFNNDIESEGFYHSNFWGQEMIVSYTKSPYNGWKYISVLPAKLVMQKVIYIKRIVWGYVFLSLLAGAIIAYLLTAKNTEPLKKALDLIKEHLEGGAEKENDAFRFLQGSIAQLIKNNQSLQETIKKHMPIIRTAFFERLLKGGFTKIEQINAVASYVGLQIKGNRFLVMILRIFGQDEILSRDIIEESNLTKAVLMETIDKYIDGFGYLHDLDQNNIAIILAFENLSGEQCYQKAAAIVRKIEDEISEIYKLKVCFGGGNIYQNLLDVWQSFQEAGRVLDYKAVDLDSTLIWYADLPKHGTEYYYPLDFEQRLTNYVKAGEVEQVAGLLRTIYRENTEDRQLSPEMGVELIYELKGTVIKLISELSIHKGLIEADLNKIDYSESFDANYQRLTAIFKKLCGEVASNRKFRNVQLKERIIEFIKNHYHLQDLSLHKTASHFGLSEGYLSHFFKDQVGENFIVFLERERIEHACDLLRDARLSVAEIAGRVGYNSVHSFRRAFKKVKGINPTAFRTLYLNKALHQ